MLEKAKFIDLTHDLDSSIPTWTGGCGFSYENALDYDQGVRAQKVRMHAGIGTHMDAPTHFIEGSDNIADISLENLIVPLIVIDARPFACLDFFLSPKHIEQFEKKHGRILKNSLVAVSFGWSTYWNSPDQFRAVDQEGKMHFPGLNKESAELLVKRDIAGLGVDTLSPDGANCTHFPVHETILGAKKYIIENLCNLEKVPAVGAHVIALPIKSREGTEAPIRAVALVP